jgi:opacity protein-like surface antigen
MAGKALLILCCLALGPKVAYAEEVLVGRMAIPAKNQDSAQGSTQPLVASGADKSGKADNTTSATPASQRKGFYLTGAAGMNWPQNADVKSIDPDFQNYGYKEYHKPGVSIEAGAGYDFGSLRAEITYAYDRSALSGYNDSTEYTKYNNNSYVNKNSALASLYWDVDLKSRFSPYIGAGIGYSSLNVSASSDAFATYDSYQANGLGYQAKAGINYLINNRSDMFAEAVYRGMGRYQAYDGSTNYQYNNYNSWGFQIGARYRFGAK